MLGRDLAILQAPMFVGRPRSLKRRGWLAPANLAPDTDVVDPHVLKAIAKAWSWRRKLESGVAGTLSDIAGAEDVTPAYAGRILKLAYLAPAVLETLLIRRMPPAMSIKYLAMATDFVGPRKNPQRLGWVRKPVCASFHTHSRSIASVIIAREFPFL
jgi:hypothetical protein